jgi:dTMP kinase
MFVVFEGTDGSGKTTVSNQVAERLRAAGLKVTHLRAEGKFVSAVSEAIRDLGRDARNLELTPQAEFLLYVARDVQLIEEALRPALGRGDVVLADRFLYTADVLGREGRHLPASFTQPILDAAAGGLEPDLVILVDVDPVLARARRKAYKLSVADKRPPSRKGLSGVGLQHRVRRGYLQLAASQPERWAVVKNELALETTVASVPELIRSAHANGASAALNAFRSRAGAGSHSIPPPCTSVESALARFLSWIDLRMEREPRVAAYVLGGMFGAGVDERRRVLAQRVPEAVLAALEGRQDALSWELRDALRSEFPAAVARSLSGIQNTDERASVMRRALAELVPEEVLGSISRQDDAASWSLRDRFLTLLPNAVFGSLGGIDTQLAWSVRERWLTAQGSAVGASYESARLLAKTLTHLGGERAWKLRKQARVTAPVAALASIGTLTDEEAFRWRLESVKLAPKVVMATLKGLREPVAWQLRSVVLNDCKEAIDSLQDLDDEQAWQLREDARDLWPSTVVKSLGPLADSPRGRALLLRQLEAHPDNISLLKHASAVALGVHRELPFGD